MSFLLYKSVTDSYLKQTSPLAGEGFQVLRSPSLVSHLLNAVLDDLACLAQWNSLMSRSRLLLLPHVFLIYCYASSSLGDTEVCLNLPLKSYFLPG